MSNTARESNRASAHDQLLMTESNRRDDRPRRPHMSPSLRREDGEAWSDRRAPVVNEARTLNLGSTTLDLSSLPDDQQQAIRRKHAETSIGLQEREVRMAQDLHAFNHQLGTAVHHASEAAREGVVTTITNTHEDTLGQRQIVVGNSEQARSGKMTLSQAGHLRGLSLQMSALIGLGIVVLGTLIALTVVLSNG